MRLLAAALAAVAVLTGCGVPNDAEPRALDASTAPFRFYEEPEAAAQGPGQVALYFVRGDRVVLQRRPVEESTSIDEALALLLAGPTPQEVEEGTRTALPPGLAVEQLSVGRNGVAVVSLDGTTQIGTSPLAFAQIVATLTAPGRACTVRFRVDGEDVPALRGDGTPTTAPVARDDYQDLLMLQDGSPSAAPSPVPC